MNESFNIQQTSNMADGSHAGIQLPLPLAGLQPVMTMTASGRNMTDDAISEGDELKVLITTAVSDGDVLVVAIGGTPTVRALFTDEQGRRWLVPRDERCDAMLFDGDTPVSVVGKVVSIEKRVVRAPSAYCLRAIRRTAARQADQQPPSPQKVDDTIAQVAPLVTNSRQWYAVFRALADDGVMATGRYREFCQRVAAVVSAHPHLPVAKELGRLAVLSFRKRVALWDASDAPVSGWRFDEYLNIARQTAALLQK